MSNVSISHDSVVMKVTVISLNTELSMGIKWHEICLPENIQTCKLQTLMSWACEHENTAGYFCNKIACLWSIISGTDEKMINLNKEERNSRKSFIMIDAVIANGSKRRRSFYSALKHPLTTQIPAHATHLIGQDFIIHWDNDLMKI